MPKFNSPNVQISIDGLFLFSFQQNRSRGVARIQTAAEDHGLKIKIKESGKKPVEHTFSRKEVKDFGKISVSVIEEATGKPVKNSAMAASSFDRILDIEGADFYRGQCKLKSGKYGTSIFFNHGVMEAGNIVNGGIATDCYRVKEELFNSLPSKPVTPGDWADFVRDAKRKDPESIKELPKFASEALLNLALEPGLALSVTGGKGGKELFPNLKFGNKYQIEITYQDNKPPKHLAECIGFAHHCKSLRLPAKSPIYGLFRVRFKGLGGRTPSACCFIARVAN